MIIVLLTSKYYISHHHIMPTGRRYIKYDVGTIAGTPPNQPPRYCCGGGGQLPIANAVSTVIVVYVTTRVPYCDTYCTPEPLLSSFFFTSNQLVVRHIITIKQRSSFSSGLQRHSAALNYSYACTNSTLHTHTYLYIILYLYT